MSTRALAIVACVCAFTTVSLASAATQQSAGSAITYRTLFQDPGTEPRPDYSLENRAVELINATPAGEQITFAFRDYNRNPTADALIAAQTRGVAVDGVVDGGEANRTVVRRLVTTLGPQHMVVCGSPAFVFNSCIANSLAPSLQHNKFLTFSGLADGRRDVVLQTSENFYAPTQFNYYNDMVEIDGDHALYEGYVRYLLDLEAQVRSDDHYLVTSGDDGRNTMFPAPRRQRDVDTDDTIVDRMTEIDCSEGGSSTGRGMIRVASMVFRSERAVIMRKLVALHRAGCGIDIVTSAADGDILAGLVSEGIAVHPFFMRALGARPQVFVHDKFWLVDAKSTLSGRRTKIVYAGSSNWRADEQKSDDMLLRIVDDGVYDAYLGYWGLIKDRAVSDLNLVSSEAVPPVSALTATPPVNANGPNDTDVTLRIAASDGHDVGESGVKRLHVEMAGAQNASQDFLGQQDGYSVQDVTIRPEGTTTVRYFAEDQAGNREPAKSVTVTIAKPVQVAGEVGATVPATLTLTLAGSPVSFGRFTPGIARTYLASAAAGVTSTAGEATLSVLDAATAVPGHLTNGAFALAQPLRVSAASTVATPGDALAPLGSAPTTLLRYPAPVTNDPVTLSFSQTINATDSLRSGSYGAIITFTLSATTP